jgi:hypothetical protein
MSNVKKQGQQKPLPASLDKFEPGSELGPIEDRNKREQRLNSLPPKQKVLALETTRFADLCQYFSHQKMELAPPVLEQAGRLSRLAIAERIRVLKGINRELMEYLNDVGQGSGIRR